LRTDDVAQPCDDLGKPVSFLDATIRGRSGIRPVRDHLNGREKQTVAEESSAGFSEQFEKRMKAIQDQWEAQRKATADLIEQQWNAQKKAFEDLLEQQRNPQIAEWWDAQRKAVADLADQQRKAVADMVERQKKAIEDLFRRKPE
jgi:hypothetical protein